MKSNPDTYFHLNIVRQGKNLKFFNSFESYFIENDSLKHVFFIISSNTNYDRPYLTKVLL